MRIALQRFFAICGPARIRRWQRKLIQKYLRDDSCTWEFNPPHASHMGGAWECIIGITQRILDSMLMQVKSQPFSYEVLCTFMAEITANSPLRLTPAMLLTPKGWITSSNGSILRRQPLKTEMEVGAESNQFWYRWRRDYLPTRWEWTCRKWKTSLPDIQKGDLVLMRDAQAAHNEWPMALVSKVQMRRCIR